jgi:heparan-alpha-glucosaminide N-acetyltransferase
MLYDRVNSIDTTRGLIIILILLFNFFFINYLPLWPSLNDENNLLNIAGGLLYPAFIFIYCVTIPFSITKRINEGSDNYEISRSIFAKALILITIGVLLVNTVRVEPSETGISRFLWSSLLIVAIFFVWNRYTEKENNFFTTTGLRLIGLAALVVLIFKFRSGSFENNGSLIPGWWELPGLTGWAYLTAAFSYLLTRNSLFSTGILLTLFLALNVLDYFGYIEFLNPVKPFFGVLTGGYIPVIALSGLITGIIIRKFTVSNSRLTVMVMMLCGLISFGAGLSAERFLFTAGVYGNPAWALLATGTALILFSAVFFHDEVLNAIKWPDFLRNTGINMITAYLIHFFLINIAGLTGLNILFFREYQNPLISLLASGIWVSLIILVLNLLLKLNIRLKF